MKWYVTIVFMIFYDFAEAQYRSCGGFGISMPNARAVHADNQNVLHVPLVIHILYATPRQNLSYEQIVSQIKATNEDFRRQNADTVSTIPSFRSIAGDTKIEFHLSDRVGAPGENGVIRHATEHGPFLNEDIHYSEQSGSDAVDAGNLLNIWVADLQGATFAYSKSVPEFPAGEEGVVIDYEYFGTTGTAKAPFHLGRTLTHELGHWLGLAHPWSDKACKDGDAVSDTPVQDGPSFGCNLTRTTCGSLDMVQNFMSLSEDACMNLFTKGQVDVMRTTLLSSKKSFYTIYLPTRNSEFFEESLWVYPNPFEKIINVEAREGLILRSFQITDLTGKLVISDITHAGKLYKIKPLPEVSGTYFLTIETDKGLVRRRLITKK